VFNHDFKQVEFCGGGGVSYDVVNSAVLEVYGLHLNVFCS
jgi:hypothetical protein